MSSDDSESNGFSNLIPLLACIGIAVAMGFFFMGRIAPPETLLPTPTATGQYTPPIEPPVAIVPTQDPLPPRVIQVQGLTNFWDSDRTVAMWWDEMVPEIKNAAIPTGDESNIRRVDYAGAKICQECHPGKHEDWWKHAHRRMNALADKENVVGDFSGNASIRYLGSVGKFYEQEDGFRMDIDYEGTNRVYEINRTIGSRFFQYYIGRIIRSNGSVTRQQRDVDHVLPFGYWIGKQEWVPTVHVLSDDRSGEISANPFKTDTVVPYDHSCSVCHTTLSAGDWITRKNGGIRLTEYTPHSVHFDLGKYIIENHPELSGGHTHPAEFSDAEVQNVNTAVTHLPAVENAVNLGISCEACHNGSAQHAAQSTKTESKLLPSFFPVSPLIASSDRDPKQLRGRNPENFHMVCGKCHSGRRPEFANGTHTWNSTEFADAVRGSCYSPVKAESLGMDPLTCIHCHDPHESIGQSWKPTPQQDDQKCLDCHGQFRESDALTAHTHHLIASEGSRCLNCHMPKLNEGLEDVVRTHRIFNPTDPDMIEKNQPNACNLCHADKPISWTTDKLREWYGSQHSFSAEQITANYQADQPVGIGWLQSKHAPTRLAAASAIGQGPHAKQMMGELLRLLIEDDSLINRQFIQKVIEERFGTDLRKDNYRFYNGQDERRAAIDQIAPRFR
jgi:hypothetical protein